VTNNGLVLLSADRLTSNVPSLVTDFERVSAIVDRELPREIDGKAAILEMKAAEGQWRQMEWIGWYLEHFVASKVLDTVDGTAGPTYGSTTIDLMLTGPWDLKVHPMDKPATILNDAEAVHACIEEHGYINYFLLEGTATYDDDMRSFKQWHDDLKGNPSNYMKKGSATGRRSRLRKTSFRPVKMLGIHLDAVALRHGISTGAIKPFQEGMKNSNGKKRRGKYQIYPDRIDGHIINVSTDRNPTAPGQ